MSVLPVAPTGPLRLMPIQRLTHGGRWRTEAMRSYRTPLLLWFTRGQGRITVAGLTRGYGPHNAIFIPADTMHGFDVSGKVFGTAVFFNAATDVTLPDRPCHVRIRDGRVQAEMSGMLDVIQREIVEERPQHDRALHHYGGLLAVWLDRQRACSSDSADESPARDLVGRYTAAIEKQLYTGQSVGDYAESLGVSSTHLSQVCNQTCGRPASEILADRLTFEARRLLLETALPVKRVAEMLGYSSDAYFTRAFQHQTGQTPTEFRGARHG